MGRGSLGGHPPRGLSSLTAVDVHAGSELDAERTESGESCVDK